MKKLNSIKFGTEISSGDTKVGIKVGQSLLNVFLLNTFREVEQTNAKCNKKWDSALVIVLIKMQLFFYFQVSLDDNDDDDNRSRKLILTHFA